MNPVPVMKLVEIIRGLATSDETTEYVTDLSLRLGQMGLEDRMQGDFHVEGGAHQGDDPHRGNGMTAQIEEVVADPRLFHAQCLLPD